MLISGYVTVIVPVHNGAMTLRRCLDAIAEQTYRPLELVVVDDGSTDASPGWVRSFRLAHPELSVQVLSQPQAGVGAALAAGLAAARGEFVAFAHQADVWHPEKLSRQVRALQADPEATCSLGDVTEEIGAARYHRPAARVRRGWLLEPVSLSALVARRRSVEAVGGFDADPTLAAAADLAGRLSAAGSCVRVREEVATCLRGGPDTLEAARMEATLEKRFREGRLSEPERRRVQARFHDALGWQALLADQPEAARECFRRALEARPWSAMARLGLGCARLDRWLLATGLLKPRAGLAPVRR